MYSSRHILLKLFFWLTTLVVFSHAQSPCDIYTEHFECHQNENPTTSRPLQRNTEEYDCYTDLVGTTLDLMSRGDEEIELSNGDEAVMLIGITGTGKSTLGYFLAGNNSMMISYKKSTSNYLIKNCNRKISTNSTIVPATIFPDLIVHESGLAFYDNPDFHDTRTSCVEIANAYFMRKVAEHVKKVKFVFVINHSSIEFGQDMHAFTYMLRNVMRFLLEVEKYGEALTLIGTKLRIHTAEPNENEYISDARLFMEQGLAVLDQVFTDPDELRKASFIVNTLINKTTNKIGLFRMPTNCGLLSELENMQGNKRNLSRVIMENSEFVISDPSDFGYTISSEAKIAILEISRQLNNEFVLTMQEFSQGLYNYLLMQINCSSTNACGVVIADLRVLFNNPDFFDGYADEGTWKSLNYTDVVGRILNDTFLPPNLTIDPKISKILARNARYLEFFAPMADLNIEVMHWLEPMKNIRTDLKTQTLSLISNINQASKSILENLAIDLSTEFTQQIQRLENGTRLDTQLQTSLLNLRSSSYNSTLMPDLAPSTYMQEVVQNGRLIWKLVKMT